VLLAVAGESADVRLLSLAAASQPARMIQMPMDGVSQLAFPPEGTMMAAGYCYDSQVTLTDLATGKIVRSLRGHAAPVRSVAWSRDGRRVVSGSMDGTVKIWDPAAGRLLATLVALPSRDGAEPSADWVAFTPEGYFVGSEGAPSFIQWRVGHGIFPFEEHGARLNRPDLVARSLAP
jgi:WD40 repeat protein